MKSIPPDAGKASKRGPRSISRPPIEGACSRDTARLHGLWRRWQARPDDDQARATFDETLAQSVARRQARAAKLPQAAVDPGLPIAAEAARIVELIQQHQVIVIAGETGSGKTTQLPKLCLAAGRGAAGMIGCTQPRRIAARAVARRVAEELQVPLGGAVGYQVRFNERIGEDTAVKFMTDGILLAEIASDRWLSAYDTLIIDEAHERSLNIDFLLGYLKPLLRKRRDLKLIVTSATIDTARFSAHFGDAPVVDVEGRGYPVELEYRPLDGEKEEGGGRSMLDGIVAACDEIARGRTLGDTLIFLPGEREIREAHRALQERKYRHTEVLPLYARLSVRDQDRVFKPGPQRRIVLATNVAETSLTVPRIHYVVDPGLARVKRYSPRQKLDRLHIEPVSQASADQRKGRCGRIAPGICYRLYSEADFESRAAYTDPEIRRAALAGVILRMLSLGLGDVDEFPFLEPPEPRAIADGWQQLQELGAVDERRSLTPIGRTMARLPVDAKLARMLVAANEHGCLHEMLAITSFLGIQDPRERPADQRAAADAAHAEFRDPKSEFAAILNLWKAYSAAHEALTQSQLRKWCDKRFLGFLRMREWRELHRQLKLQCEALGWVSHHVGGPLARVMASDGPRMAGPGDPVPVAVRQGRQRRSKPDAPSAAPYIALHRALIAGLPTQIGHRMPPGKDRKAGVQYEGPRGRRFQLFPGSTLASKPPPWVLSATLLDTEKLWSLTNAAIEPEWAMDELPHLLARRHFDPHWSRSQGRVIGSEQVSLYGLVLAPKQPIHYGGLYPEASREIFLRDGVVAGEINIRSVFVARNRKMLAQAEEEEAKQRRAGLVVDEEWMAQWYAQRIPAEIVSAQALDAWYAKLPAEKKGQLEWSLDDLLLADGADADLYPPYLALGEARLALRYRFEPGAPDDGMTVNVPLHLLNALDDARLSWLAPGLVQDKAVAMIKSLPKVLRRNFVPAPDFARAFAEAHGHEQVDAFAGALARFLKRITGTEVAGIDFDESALEPHLRANLRLIDADGRSVLAESRDLEELRTYFGERAAVDFATRAAEGLAQAGLTTFPDQPIPESVPGAGGVPAYPALQDDACPEHGRGSGSVSLAVHADRDQARRRHPHGVRRLLQIALTDHSKRARKQLPLAPKTALLYAAIESVAPRPAEPGRPADHLREDLVDGAFTALARDGLGDIRDATAFAVCRDAIARDLLGEAMRRLQQAETIMALVGEVRVKLDSELVGWARGNLDDMQAQLAALVPPGFLRKVPAQALAEYPRYLKTLALRAERALNDPVRDQQRMLDLKPFSDALAEAAELGVDGEPDWQALRWDLEELRVSLFAQELGAKGGVSPKKLAQKLAVLQKGTEAIKRA